MASASIAILNPSNYWRRGVVVMEWAPFAKVLGRNSECASVIFREEVPTQVDRISEDRDRDELAFEAPHDIRPGDEHYETECARASVTTAAQPQASGPTAERIDYGVKLRNSKIEAWIFVTPNPWGGDRPWYAGAITSLQIFDARYPDPMQVLDANRALIGWGGHDNEKRLQLAAIEIARPPWDSTARDTFNMFNRPHIVEAAGSGPVRAWVTVKSREFEYTYKDITSGTASTYVCTLHRCISLYRDADFLIESVWVSTPFTGRKASRLELAFNARYFLQMDFGLNPRITHLPLMPDWFSIACSDMEPHPGFGFATDVHCEHVYNPPVDFPNPAREHRAFSWNTGVGFGMKCIHMFRLGIQPEAMAQDAGHGWYEFIYQPLRARIVGASEAAQ
jgi:hypothetical protein